MQKCLSGSEGRAGSLRPPSTFYMDAEGRFELRNGVQLHMFISQPPCGDACVIGPNLQPVSRLPTCTVSADTTRTQQTPIQQTNIRHTADAAAMQQSQSAKQEGSDRSRVYSRKGSPAAWTQTDSHPTTRRSASGLRLSAASVSAGMQLTASRFAASPTLPGLGCLVEDSQGSQAGLQQAQGMLRGACTASQRGEGGLCRKPGRGDTTLSMSCSDKLARWTLLGVQVCRNRCCCSSGLRVCRVGKIALSGCCLSCFVGSATGYTSWSSLEALALVCTC